MNSLSAWVNTPVTRLVVILSAFVVGYFCPHLSAYSSWISVLIVVMLLLTFIKMRWDQLALRKSHFVLALANMGLPLLAWFILKALGYELLAQMALFIGLTPTATAAPVIMGFMGGNVGFVMTGVVVSSLVMAVFIPLVLPFCLGVGSLGASGGSLSMMLSIAKSLGLVLGLSFVGGQLIRFFWPTSVKIAKKADFPQFLLWAVVLTLIAASGSAFVRSHGSLGKEIFIQMAAVALGTCILSFVVGYFLGSKGLKRESSQCLGQKNTALTIYLALEYANPLIALAITFYTVFHNLWSALHIQLVAWQDHKNLKSPAPSLLKKEEAEAFDEE